MSVIRNIVVAVVAFIILYMFIQQARLMHAPPVFMAVAALMVVLILLNLGRSVLRGF